MTDLEVFKVMQHVARRWASQRKVEQGANVGHPQDIEARAKLLRDLFNQGWLPSTIEEWGESAALTLARLGEALAADAPSAYMIILTHCLGVHLLGSRSKRAPWPLLDNSLIACSPYIDYSDANSWVRFEKRDNGWILNGHYPWVVNCDATCHVLVAARSCEQPVALFRFELPAGGSELSSRLRLFGLCGSSVRHVSLNAVALSECNLVSEGLDALDILANGYRVARWGVAGLLAGLVGCILDAAVSYAELRIQGGRPIIEHTAVRQLIDTTRASHVQLIQTIARLHEAPLMDCPIAGIRQLALRASDQALQVFGGSGYVCPNLPERCWRDVRQTVALCSTSNLVMPEVTASGVIQ